MEHKEFVVKLKSGKYDWIDPVDEVYWIGPLLVVKAMTGYKYPYELKDIDQWVVREYDEENIFPFGEWDTERKAHHEALYQEHTHHG